MTFIGGKSAMKWAVLFLFLIVLIKASSPENEFDSALSSYRQYMESSLSEGPYATKEYLRDLRRQKRRFDRKMRREILHYRRNNLRAAAGELASFQQLQKEFDDRLREELEEMKIICKMPLTEQTYYSLLFKCEFIFWNDMEKVDKSFEKGQIEEVDLWLETTYADLMLRIERALTYAHKWNLGDEKALVMRDHLLGLWNSKKDEVSALKKGDQMIAPDRVESNHPTRLRIGNFKLFPLRNTIKHCSVKSHRVQRDPK